MRIVQTKHRAGDLSLDKHGGIADMERAVLPTIIYAGLRSGKHRIAIFGIGWWKWGIRLTIHMRFR